MHYKIVELSFIQRRVSTTNEIPTSTIEGLADEYGCELIHILSDREKEMFMNYYNKYGNGILFDAKNKTANVTPALKWFQGRFENLQDMIGNMKLEDFCKIQYAQTIQDMTGRKFDTLIYTLDYDELISLDDFIRLRHNYGDEGKILYVGRIFDYHI